MKLVARLHAGPAGAATASPCSPTEDRTPRSPALLTHPLPIVCAYEKPCTLTRKLKENAPGPHPGVTIDQFVFNPRAEENL